MSADFCLHCGLRRGDELVELVGDGVVHQRCIDAFNANQAAEANRPKTQMERQLNRIEELVKAIRDNQSWIPPQ